MSELQPSPDVQELFDRLDITARVSYGWGVSLAKPIITEWAKQRDAELAALREENQRLQGALDFVRAGDDGLLKVGVIVAQRLQDRLDTAVDLLRKAQPLAAYSDHQAGPNLRAEWFARYTDFMADADA